MFLVCNEQGSSDKYFQIWRNDKSEGFSLAQLGRLPSGTQAISFADMDRDGTIDMVFVTCTSVSSSTGVGSDCMINIAYNQQLPLCTSTTTGSVKNGKRVCRPADDLCVADPNFRFDLSERADNDVRLVFLVNKLNHLRYNYKAFVRIPVSDISPSSSMLVLDTQTSPAVPLPIRLGDSNLDGFPDLLFITASSPHGGFLGIGDKSDRTPRLAFSVPCGKGVPGCSSNGAKRGYKIVKKDAEVLNAVVDASGVAFFDIDEDVSVATEVVSSF